MTGMDTLQGWGTWVLGAALALSGCGDDGPASGNDGTDGDPATTGNTSAAETDDGGNDESGDSTGAEPSDVEVEFLSPVEHLVRASMALRGSRPSLADVEAVANDANALDGIVDRYLDAPGFGRTMMALHNEALLVEPDYAYYPAGFPNVGPLEGRDFYEINRDVMQAPLRLVEHVVMNDRPYSEVVTADYTLANDTVAAVWGLPYEGQGGWEVTAWDDGRDNAGVLSDSWLFQRHRSTDANANRGRANLVTTAFLCADFSSNDVDIDVSIDLSDPEAVADAVLENPSCATCHAQLDPLASYFRGFFPLYVPDEVRTDTDPPHYPMELPWYKEFFTQILGVPMQPPAYYGEEGDGLAFLGQRIAEDSRFSECAVRRFWSYLHQTPLEEVPPEALEAFDADFASAMNAKALAKAIVLHDDFRTARVVAADPDAPTEAEAEAAANYGLLKARPEALATTIEDLTGFRWITDFSTIIDEETDEPLNLGRVPLLEDSFLGYRVLGGGIDSTFVTQSAHTYSAPNLLVLTNLAREAAHFVVEADAEANGANRKLFSSNPDNTDEGSVRDELRALHLRLYAQEASDDDVDTLWSLYSAALDASNEPRRAWKTTLTAMLSDLRIAFY